MYIPTNIYKFIVYKWTHKMLSGKRRKKNGGDESSGADDERCGKLKYQQSLQ